jgi:thiol-disulfide isomerase/thioredoxin
MKKSILLLVSLAAGCSAFWGTLQAGTAPIKIGDAPPALQVGKWAQGEPVTGFEKGKTYIVEFWATWCGPCRVSIPHLNEIHQKFKDKGLVVIGQDCWENDETLVAPFIKKMGDKMTYRVALDDKEGNPKGKMAENWMLAAGQNGIPTAFIVNPDGVLAWIGHPMNLNDGIIASIIDRTFDIQKAAAAFLNQGKINALQQAFGKGIQNKDWAAAEEAVAELEKVGDKDEAREMRVYLLSSKRDYKGAYEVLEAIHPKSGAPKPSNQVAQAFNQFAWGIAIDEAATPEDLALGSKAAERGIALAEDGGAAILDTQARLLFRSNKRDEAIQTEEKALKLAPTELKAELEQTLASYRKGELPKANELNR